MIDRDEPIRVCFAYNAQRQRCDMPGGHPGNHAFTVTWTDEECYDPTAPVEVTLKEYGTPRFTTPPPMEGDTDECLICDHRMHRGMCRVEDCDCKNGMPK